MVPPNGSPPMGLQVPATSGLPATCRSVVMDASLPTRAAGIDPSPVMIDAGAPGAVSDLLVDPDLLADLDHPRLVLSDGYVGPDRRSRGPLAALRRTALGARRRSSTLGILVVSSLSVMVVAALTIGLGAGTSTTGHQVGSRVGHDAAILRTSGLARGTTSAGTGIVPAAGSATDLSTPSASNSGSGVVSEPESSGAGTTAPSSGTTATSTAAAAAVPPVTQPAPAPPADLTPAQLGAEALSLVRYPWQSIPGYTIQFLPIADAPSPGFYGNTTFTWGQAGGTSVLYVYPGETPEHLAAITAFEIGHEVDAAAVEPQGGHGQIEDILGLHPASWAPNCDCAEQGFLSGWYAAAFSNYWSPGVGAWSTLAPEPSGPVLAAVERWLNPPVG